MSSVKTLTVPVATSATNQTTTAVRTAKDKGGKYIWNPTTEEWDLAPDFKTASASRDDGFDAFTHYSLDMGCQHLSEESGVGMSNPTKQTIFDSQTGGLMCDCKTCATAWETTLKANEGDLPKAMKAYITEKQKYAGNIVLWGMERFATRRKPQAMLDMVRFFMAHGKTIEAWLLKHPELRAKAGK